MPDTAVERNLLAEVTAIVAAALRVKPELITPGSRLFRDLDAESLDMIDIRFQIEHQYGIKIDQGEIYHALGRELTTDEIQEHLTVASIVQFVRGRLAGAGNGA